MSIEVKVYDNGDHTCLVWLPSDPQTIKNCRGFTIKKVRNGTAPVYLHSFVGFSDKDQLPADHWKWPLQRYMWWDYLIDPGDVVQYTVIPVVGSDKDHLELAEDLASPETDEMKITGQDTPHISAYFNKGIVAAQWVSRAMDKEPKGSSIKDLVTHEGDPMRNALSGLLRPQILDLLTEAKTSGGKIYAALYELNDPELIQALVDLGDNCNLILGNGAFKPPSHDENAQVRAHLKTTKIHVYDRIVTSGHFAHNKVVVFCDADGNAQKVLTGSTNWTSSGLCTQANNGLIIDDPEVAQDYLDAWNRIHAAGNGFPPTLINANSTAKTFTVDGCSVTPWHVPTSHAQDLDYARKLINAAKEGILFLFFNPGTFQPDDEPEKWTLLQNILNRHHEENNAYYDPNLYIKGVVNQDIPYLTADDVKQKGKKPPAQAMDPTQSAQPVALYSSGIEPPVRLSHDVLVPANIKTQFGPWEEELLRAGIVNIHSKVIVIDPFGAHPVVMTGSHNLGFKASSKNDDNLIIIEGNGALAAAYAINIIAIFQTYRWNSYVEAHRKDPRAWHGLQDKDSWQTSHMQTDLPEIDFWLGEAEPVSAAAPAGGERTRSTGSTAPVPVPATTAKHHPAVHARGPVHRPKSVRAGKTHGKKQPAA